MIPMYFPVPPSSSHLKASIYKKNAGGIFFFFVFKVLLLNISKTDSVIYSDSDC